MNEKQAKLLRYFVKHSGDLVLAGQLKAKWSELNHRQKGNITTWLKKVIVTMMHVSQEKKRELLAHNKKVLDGFCT